MHCIIIIVTILVLYLSVRSISSLPGMGSMKSSTQTADPFINRHRAAEIHRAERQFNKEQSLFAPGAESFAGPINTLPSMNGDNLDIPDILREQNICISNSRISLYNIPGCTL